MRRLGEAAVSSLLYVLTTAMSAAQSLPCPVESLTVDPSNPLVLYATGSGGLFGSIDGGPTWRLLYAGGAGNPAVDPGDSQHLLLSSGKGLVESQDGGRSWTELAVPPPPLPVLRRLSGVAIDPFERETLYVVGSYGPGTGIFTFVYLYKSVDGGQSWNSVLSAAEVMTAPVLDPSSAGRLLVAVWGGAYTSAGPLLGGVLMSQDGGLTWSTSLEGTFGNDLVADPADPRVLHVKIACNTYATSDRGRTWQVFPLVNDCHVDNLVAGPSEVFANGVDGVLISRSGSLGWQPFLPPGNTVLAADPSNGDVLYLRNGSALLKSVDGGQTFRVLCGLLLRDVRRSGPRGAVRVVRERQ